MIWNGKRAQGIQVYRGKRGTEFAGEYIIVYFCNGRHGAKREMIDAFVGLQAGDIWPNSGASIHSDLLRDAYTKVSYRNLTDQARIKLVSYIFDD